VQLDRIDASDLHPATPVVAEATAFARVTIIGGKFHEVRRIFAALGSHVLGLCRTHYGEVHLPEDLEAGQWREVDLKAQFAGRHPRP
jgi:16S rRNA pseudouridine516 synthase